MLSLLATDIKLGELGVILLLKVRHKKTKSCSFLSGESEKSGKILVILFIANISHQSAIPCRFIKLMSVLENNIAVLEGIIANRRSTKPAVMNGQPISDEDINRLQALAN